MKDFFKTKYRIIGEMNLISEEKGYRVQSWCWLWPFWTDELFAWFLSLETAKNYIDEKDTKVFFQTGNKQI